MDKPSVGRIIHYVGWGTGNHYAAVVTKVYEDETIGLHMFADPELAKLQAVNTSPNVGWGSPDISNVKYSDGNEPGTWHWPERV